MKVALVRYGCGIKVMGFVEEHDPALMELLEGPPPPETAAGDEESAPPRLHLFAPAEVILDMRPVVNPLAPESTMVRPVAMPIPYQVPDTWIELEEIIEAGVYDPEPPPPPEDGADKPEDHRPNLVLVYLEVTRHSFTPPAPAERRLTPPLRRKIAKPGG